MGTFRELFADIADAIRGKDGSMGAIVAIDFPDRIAAIPAGGSEPTGGTPYALLYEDGYMSIQFGQEAYDEASHGQVVRVYTDFVFEDVEYPGSIEWPWENDRLLIRAVVARHKVELPFVYDMFKRCTNLAYADLNKLQLSRVTDLGGVFSYDTSLKMVCCSEWDLGNVTIAQGTFYNCSALTEVDCSGWGMGSCDNAFNGCGKLAALDVSAWGPTKALLLYRTFYGCSALAYLLLEAWGAVRVDNLNAAFYHVAVELMDLSAWDVSGCSTMASTFSYLTNLKTLDISGWDTSSMVNLTSMFMGCSALTTIWAGDGWTTKAVTSSGNNNYVFNSCTSLVGGNGTTFSGSHANMEYARINAEDAPGYFTRKE